MCVNAVDGCGCDNETAVTIKAPVRVAPGQDASIIKGFDVPTPYGKGK
jgi:hypothetical protein